MALDLWDLEETEACSVIPRVCLVRRGLAVLAMQG